jgi:hypothetical protein
LSVIALLEQHPLPQPASTPVAAPEAL